MPARLKIDLFADVVCPWCLVGATRLDRAVAELPPDVEVDIENHPFYLDPNTPPEGYDVEEMLRSRYNRDPRPMQERVEAEAAKAGVALDLRQQPRSYPTKKAHTLTRLARAKGGQHELANAIAEAYFIEHRQINDDAVLADVARRFGWTEDEALAAIRDPEELAITEQMARSVAASGITGVPFFIFGQRFALSGAQPQEVFERALKAALESEPQPA